MFSRKQNSNHNISFIRFAIVMWLLCLSCAVLLLAGTLIHDMRLEDFYYDSTLVESICEKFEISSNDAFCADPTIQNPTTFERMLERNFPIGETTYSTIMPHLKDVKAFSEDCGTGLRDPRDSYCPPPEECGSGRYPDYRCAIKFPDDILGMRIHFEKSSGLVTKYVAIWPSSS